MNGLAFVLSAGIVFALSVHPQTTDIGLAFFVWLAPAGTLALIFEERALSVAERVKGGVRVAGMFGRRGRKRLDGDPDAFFEPGDYREYQRRTRALTRLAMLAIAALITVTIVVSVDDVLEVRAAIEDARQPWWFRN